jgi:hypothetical protein
VEFTRAKALPDGAKLSEHQQSAAAILERMGRKKAAAAVEVETGNPLSLPLGAEHVWASFVEITLGMESKGLGGAVVGWELLAAWQSVTRAPLDPWEARAIVRLGRLLTKIMNKKD